MNINIVSGKSSENNNKTIFDLLKKRDKTKKHIIIAPDRCLFSIEKRLFDELNESCFFDLSVTSMTGLSRAVVSGKHSKKILTKNSGIALVRKLLNDNKDKLLSFKKATSFMGFARTIFETICLYKSCNISPEEVYTDDTVNYSNLKQKDIKLIYTAYEEYLKKDYTDSFNQLMLFASLIDKDMYKDTVFYLMEFDDFTSIMYGIIAKLSKYSAGIYVSCTYGKSNNNYNIYSNKVYYDLIDLYKANGLEYKVIASGDFEDSTHRLIANNLLSYNLPKPTKAEDIEIYSFENILDEVRFTVAKIYSIALEKKVDFSHFAIVVPSISEYGDRLVRELGKYNIPHYIDENKVLSDHILIRNYLAIWNMVIGKHSLSDVLNLLKSPILALDSERVTQYDHYLKVISASNFTSIPSTMLDDDTKYLFDLISNTQKTVKGISDTNVFIDESKKIFEYLIERGEKYLESLGDLDKRIYSQVINKFTAIMDDYLSVFGAVEQGIDEYLETSAVYFENTNISLPPINSNTVFIAGDSSYFSPIDYLFVLGSNETKQPVYKLDNGLITDEEIAKLPNASKINPTISAINHRKTFKIFEYFLRYNRKLYLSYPESGVENTLYPSTMLLSLMSLFGIKEVKGSYILDLINNSAECVNVDNVVFNNLTERVLVDNILRLRKQWHVFEDKRGFREMLSSLYSVNNNEYLKEVFNNEQSDGIVELANKHNLFRNDRTSVSQIECYYNCPYKHFVNYGLKLRETIKLRLMPNDIGTIFHLVFKDLIPFILNNLNDDDITSLAQSKAESLLGIVLSSEDYVDVLKNPENDIVMQSIYAEMARVTDAIIYQLKASNFKPKYYEYSFNTKDYEVEGVRFTGSIDRVDILNNKFVIIDYKTGNSEFSDFTDLHSGKKLQLMVYAKFFADKTKLEPSGVFYLPISNKFNSKSSSYKFNGVAIKDKANIVDLDTNLAYGGVSSQILHIETKNDGEMAAGAFYKRLCLTKDEMNYILDYSIMQVRRAITSIVDNNISKTPLKVDKWTACKSCNYRGLCNYLDNTDRTVEKVGTVEELKKQEGEDGEV